MKTLERQLRHFNAERWNDELLLNFIVMGVMIIRNLEKHSMKVKIFVIVLSLLLAGSQAFKIESIVVGEQAIYIIRHSWHTGFIIPAKAIQDYLPNLRARFADTPYLEIGWGDKGFYLAKEMTTGLTLEALFWSTGSVIHAVAVPLDIENNFPDSQIEKLCLTGKSYAALIRFIADSFYKNGNGELVALKNGLYGNSQFYQAVGHYNLMNTCNKWVAKALENAGIDIAPTFKLTAGSVMNYVQAYKHSLILNASELKAGQIPPASFECR